MLRKINVFKSSTYALPNCRLSSTLPSAVADDYQSASKYENIPGPSQFELIRGFLPGGKICMCVCVSSISNQYGMF